MAKVKRVVFNFFRPTVKTDDGKEKIINLQPMLEAVRKKYETEKVKKGHEERKWKYVYEYHGELARLSDISLDHKYGYYHIIFERLDYFVPNYTKLHGESKALELEDDEYIGREVNVLYDPENYVMMIQRNRDSLSPLGIEMFIRTLLIKSKTAKNFALAVITDPNARKRAFNQKAYRKIHLKITGAAADGIIEKLRGQKVVGIDTVEITFNTSAKKQDKIDDAFSKSILEEYIDRDDVIQFDIRSREKEDGLVEPIDLLEHKLMADTEFRFEKDRTLNPVSVFEEMVRIYTLDERGGYKKRIIQILGKR